jgi:YNFM family putative membrane transporter
MHGGEHPIRMSTPTPSRQAGPRAQPGDMRQMVAIFLCGSLAFVDLYCTQPLLPLLAQIFHASEGRVSLTISASTLGVAISAILLAFYGQRLNRKRTIVASILALAACSLLTATATSLPVLAVWRLLQGLVTPGIFIITIAYVTEEWPAIQVPQMMSIYVAGTVFGGFVGRIAGGILGERFGWRAVFVVLGLVGVGGGLLIRHLLRPAQAGRISSAAPHPVERALANFKNPRLLATFAIGFCMLFTLVSIFSYVTFYLALPPFGLSTTQLSWLFTVYLFGLVATLAVGPWLPRIGLRTAMLWAIATGVVGALLTMSHRLVLVAAGLALVGACVFVAQTCANSFLRDASTADGRVSAAGMYICCYYVGGTAGGLLPAPVWARFGWPGCALLTCVLLLAAGAATVVGWKARHAVAEPIPV